MNRESFDIKQDGLQRLKELFPELFAENKVDWEKLKAAFGDYINFANERYVLNWAGKSDAFRVLQQPTTATLKPAPEESVNFDTSENLFIEGENLEVLKVLQKAYYGKVKCIEIDPPYNTGSDSFIYPDRFSEKKEDYLKRIGDKDEEGYLLKEGLFRKNSKDSGHFHSNWLSMMYPRLFLAKNLLRDDGVIFVHIDDNEVHNLRLVMNEIFGEENFVVQIVWKKRSTPPNDQIIGANHDYILVFGKDRNKVGLNLRKRSNEQLERYRNPDNHPKGPWTAGDLMANVKGGRYVSSLYYPIINPNTGEEHYPSQNGNWRFNKETIKRLLENNEIYFGDDGKGRPKLKRFLRDVKQGITYPTIWDFVPLNTEGSQEMSEFLGNMNIFDNPKPSGLITELIKLGADSESLVLDFFSGSGTTAQAVMELNKEDKGNRKFILVQLPEQCDENSEAYKAGYKTIADIAKERIRRVIQKIEKEKAEKPDLFAEGTLDLGFKVFKLSSSSFKIWRGSEIDSEEKLAQQLDAFTDPIRPGAEKHNMLYELMLKAGHELASPVQYVIASGAKQSQGKKIASDSTNPRNDSIGFYSISNNELILALDAVNEKLIEQIIVAKPQKVITLDSLFAGNDQLKTNTVLQMRDAGIDFKTI
jgi:adenine-specific DNA-methyltransferase